MISRAAQAPALARPARFARRAVGIALVVGFALRLGFTFGYWMGKPLTLDEQEYVLLAQRIAAGYGLTYPAAPSGQAVRHFERPPVFPALLAAVLVATRAPMPGPALATPRLSSDVPTPIKVVQVVIGLLVIGLVAAVARQVGGGAASVAAAWVAAVYPPLVWTCGYVFSESLFAALAFAVVWLLQQAEGGNNEWAAEDMGRSGATRRRRGAAHRLVFAAGLVAGVAVLTKESLVFFVPLVVIWFLARRRLVAALVFAAAVGIALTPWVARNYGVYGRFVLTAPHGGVTFWTGNNALAHGEGDLAANPDMGRARVAFEAQHAGASVEAMDRAYYDDALAFIANHPGRWVVLLGKKLFYTVVPIGPSYRLHSRLYFATTVLSYAWLFVFAVAGASMLVRRHLWAAGWALWLLAVSAVVMSLVFFPQERFRIPVLDPTLIVCAAVWCGTRARASRV